MQQLHKPVADRAPLVALPRAWWCARYPAGMPIEAFYVSMRHALPDPFIALCIQTMRQFGVARLGCYEHYAVLLSDIQRDLRDLDVRQAAYNRLLAQLSPPVRWRGRTT